MKWSKPIRERDAHILEPLHSLQDVIPLIRWHHERCDGRGYPDGLVKSQVPKIVRILSVADVYDSLSSKRPYRPAMNAEEHAEESFACSKLSKEISIRN